MNKKFTISVIVGTLLLFIWNALSWMALPFHTDSMKNIPEGAIQTKVLKNEMPESGVYHYPGLPSENSSKELNEIASKLKEGPRITMMVYRNEATKLFEAKTFLISLFINFLTVLFTLFVISKISNTNKSSILLTSLLIGLISCLVSDISLMNWYMFPSKYTIVNIFDKLISFGLLGLLFSIYTFKKAKT